MDKTYEPLLTVEELAEVLKVKKSWIYRHTKETGPGTLPRVPVGKYRRFRLSEVMAWLEEQQKQ